MPYIRIKAFIQRLFCAKYKKALRSLQKVCKKFAKSLQKCCLPKAFEYELNST